MWRDAKNKIGLLFKNYTKFLSFNVDASFKGQKELLFMKNSYLLITIFIFLITSCNSKSSKDLIGIWSIDSIKKNEQEILFHYLSNLAYFHKNGTCSLPPVDKGNDKKGKWHIAEKGSTVYLTINIEGNDLSGTYELIFWKDYDNKLFKATLSTDKIKIICTKGLYNFDKGESW